jgi:two-component system, chemotaxis family, CheB/CheR fusion protein
LGGSTFDAVKKELLKSGYWTGELDQRTKDGRPLKVVSRLQLESFDDRKLVIEHSD